MLLKIKEKNKIKKQSYKKLKTKLLNKISKMQIKHFDKVTKNACKNI